MISSSFVYLIIALLTLCLIIYAGPRLDTKITVDEVDLPNDLDVYLENQEAQFTDIKADTEKKIFWAENDKRQTNLALVYLHGYSASRQEMSPLLEDMASKLSANIYFSRLTGHGRSNEAMAIITLSAMINDAIEAVEIGKKIGEQVVLIGNSTGATLATWIATEYTTDKILGMVLLSPNYGLNNKKSEWLLLPWARYVIPILEGSTYEFTPNNETQAKYWTYRYPIQALFPLMALVTVTKKTDLESIELPILFMYAEEDEVVNVAEIKSAYQRFGTKTKKIVQVKGTQGRQHHVLAGDALSPATTEFVSQEIEAFIQSLNTIK